eukprot:5238191-Amphidinium_carterae.1
MNASDHATKARQHLIHLCALANYLSLRRQHGKCAQVAKTTIASKFAGAESVLFSKLIVDAIKACRHLAAELHQSSAHHGDWPSSLHKQRLCGYLFGR